MPLDPPPGGPLQHSKDAAWSGRHMRIISYMYANDEMPFFCSKSSARWLAEYEDDRSAMKRRNKRQQRQRQQRQRVRQASELPLSQLLSEELISKLASADKNVSKALRFALNDKTTNGLGHVEMYLQVFVICCLRLQKLTVCRFLHANLARCRHSFCNWGERE